MHPSLIVRLAHDNAARTSTRHVALRISYLGTKLSGMVHDFSHERNQKVLIDRSSPSSISSPTLDTTSQASKQERVASRPLLPTSKTVEYHLFDALRKSKLIPMDALPEEVGYTRCARTDKGVSARENVVGLFLRSRNVHHGNHFRHWEDGSQEGIMDYRKEEGEAYPYAVILNSLLPTWIRVRGYAFVAPTFNARHDCIGRVYKYLLPHKGLDIPLIQSVLPHLVGKNDWRNFTKFNYRTVLEAYVRSMEEVRMEYHPVMKDYVVLTFRAKSFTYNQIRNIVTVLTLIGQHKESPGLVQELLDVDSFGQRGGKPIYAPAPPDNLLLWSVEYPKGMVEWVQCSKHREQMRRFTTRMVNDSAVKMEYYGSLLDDVHDGDVDMHNADHVEDQTMGAGYNRNNGRFHFDSMGVDVGRYNGRSSDKVYVPFRSRQRHENVELRLNKRVINR